MVVGGLGLASGLFCSGPMCGWSGPGERVSLRLAAGRARVVKGPGKLVSAQRRLGLGAGSLGKRHWKACQEVTNVGPVVMALR